ncbi:MAG: patatin-like phospholipase family protein [Gemmatimonadaceae bacterium]|nr:patatin-like phospholipase family protein [Gemmatimonadaceae bacterium]
MRSVLSVVLVMAFLPGCATIHRPPTTLPQLQQDAAEAARAEQVTRDSVLARLVRRAAMRGDKTLDVLMLSGGGQNGAFGAGFLRGWRSRAEASLPTFDLVTGISTGALQAPYALLGTAAAIDTLSELYRQAQDRVAPTFDWWFWLKRTGGLVNTARYDRALDQSINGEFRDALRGAFAVDRQIVFGTTDYDLGTGRTWALNDALDSTANGLARSRQLLKAATAIPGVFPPVMVDGHVHGDGGVITNVLPLLTYGDYERLATMLAERGLRGVTIRVYVLMNLWAHAEPKIITPSNRKQIATRSNYMLFYAHQPQTLELLDVLARAVSTGIPGLRVEFRVATLPSEEALAPGAEKLFDRDFMHRLDALGFAKARGAAPWDVVPSAYARPGAPAR